MMHRIVTSAGLVAAALAASSAHAEQAPSFGRAGTVVLDDVVGGRFVAAAPMPGLGGIGFQTGWLAFGSLESGAGRSRYVRLTPSVDLFVADGASLGVRLGGGILRFDSPGGEMKGWDATVAPRFGYAFDLADDVAVWPRIGAGLTVFDSPGQSRAGTTLHAAVEAPFVFRLARHVALDVGPELAYVNHLSGPVDGRGISGGARGGFSLIF